MVLLFLESTTLTRCPLFLGKLRVGPLPLDPSLLRGLDQATFDLSDEEIDWVIRCLIAQRDEYGPIERLRLLVGQDRFSEHYEQLN